MNAILVWDATSTRRHQIYYFRSCALERPWPAAARAAWRTAHERLADWACERYARRLPLPDLRTLEGIAARLGGRGARYCGAGVSTAAIDPAGRIFGCYRSAYDPRAEQLVLGDLCSGVVNELLVAAYAKLHPHRARPQQGDCRTCTARDGCIAYCAAQGHARCGDLRVVSEEACALMRAQVEICRGLVARMRKLERARRRSVGSRVAAAAFALGLSSGAAACDGNRSTPSDAAIADRAVGGLCPVGVDMSGPGVCADYDSSGPGVCAVQVDMTGPGLCDYAPDGYGPGVCPVAVDATPADARRDVIGPGLCPETLPDAAADARRDMIGPGLCPAP